MEDGFSTDRCVTGKWNGRRGDRASRDNVLRTGLLHGILWTALVSRSLITQGHANIRRSQTHRPNRQPGERANGQTGKRACWRAGVLAMSRAPSTRARKGKRGFFWGSGSLDPATPSDSPLIQTRRLRHDFATEPARAATVHQGNHQGRSRSRSPRTGGTPRLDHCFRPVLGRGFPCRHPRLLGPALPSSDRGPGFLPPEVGAIESPPTVRSVASQSERERPAELCRDHAPRSRGMVLPGVRALPPARRRTTSFPVLLGADENRFSPLPG